MRYMTSGFCRCISEICIAWCIDVIIKVNIKIHSYRFYVLHCVRYIPVFHRNLLSPSSGEKRHFHGSKHQIFMSLLREAHLLLLFLVTPHISHSCSYPSSSLQSQTHNSDMSHFLSVFYKTLNNV